MAMPINWEPRDNDNVIHNEHKIKKGGKTISLGLKEGPSGSEWELVLAKVVKWKGKDWTIYVNL